ncbi:Mitotic spindle assembly checkpoint protein MAD2A [Porphyridium purpureum]|uniref:Mitotic spindle assembly checkpoint protein MAD2A n=1 Tax=Porphyridium purpureum TaxID=35688 RepID=A0A5J4YWU2_PORPP|nr:Mitotic spindle assembly checkpoint protein MAD2A [Porphyridium purpureum]|eukprot:POR7841..scf227_4
MSSDVGVSDVFAEFLAAALHCICYVCGVYPQERFERRQLLGACVYLCTEHSVLQHIYNAVAHTMPHIVSGNVQELQIAVSRVTITDESAEPGVAEREHFRTGTPALARFVLYLVDNLVGVSWAGRWTSQVAARLVPAFRDQLTQILAVQSAPAFAHQFAVGQHAGKPKPPLTWDLCLVARPGHELRLSPEWTGKAGVSSARHASGSEYQVVVLGNAEESVPSVLRVDVLQ